MLFNEIKELIRSRSEPDVITSENTQLPQPYLVIKTESIAAVCQELFSNPQTYFDYLACITGLDNGPEAGTLEVIYNLYSIPYDHHLTLKVITPRLTPAGGLPEVPTVCHIWRTADWHEREAYDLVGINFVGHPDLRRILCAHDWEGYPLRRDYEWPEYYHGIKVRYDNHNEVNGFKGERFTGFEI